VSTLRDLRGVFLTGVAVVVPVAVSGWVVLAIANAVAGLLAPVAVVLRTVGFDSDATVVALQAASLGGVLLGVLAVGALARRRAGARVGETVAGYLERIPGLGTVYETTRRMSDLLLGGDEGAAARFREVKLVEFPGRGTYTLGFLTATEPPEGVVETARTIEGRDDGEYRTLFLPMAPNPVMGGHLTHVPADRVHDVDISTEHAVQYVLTTGVIADGGDGPEP
jgi:uncharacterized membrane protein